MLIHVIQNGNQVGPYTPAQFDDLLQKGLLSGDDLYWHEGCDGWSPVSLHPDFPQPVVLATPPPPPPRLAGVRRVGQQASTLKVCRDCGHAVSPSATSCPNCGKRLKLGCLPKLAIGFGGLVIVYIILLILFPPRGRTAGPTVAPPKAEAAFIAKVQSYVARYKAASNELQKTAVRSERAHGLAQVVTDMQVSGWVGTLKKLETTRDGQASIAIQLDGTPIKVCTAPGLLGPDSSTLIEPNSPLYDQLSSMAVGQEVRFSGSFLPDEHDHINETSLTEEGAMTEPEFVMRFSNVTVVQAGSASVAPVPAPAAVSSGSPPATLASPVPTVAPRRAQTAAAPLPEAETSFIDTVDSYISRYTAASNELQKSAVRTQRRTALARTITDLHVSGWIGTLKKLATAPSGDASISIRLEGSAISVHTDFRNPFDQGSNTLIEHSSALYNKLASLSVGDRVVFSGSFQPGETDHLQETSFTEAGSMTAPEFVMRFSEVAAASATSSSGLDASSQSSVARVEAPQGVTVPSPLPATSSSALETSPTPDSQVASLSDPKLPVVVSIKRTTATAEDDAPGDVLVAYKDGTSRLLTNGETSSQARFSPRTGTIGWVLNDPPTNRPGDGFVMSNPVRPRRTLVLYRDGKIIATLQSKLAFIEHWGFEEDGTKVVFQCRESHGPGLFQRFEVETGRLLATASENDEPLPDWAASWTVPTPAGPTNEAGALRAALASPPSTSAALLNQVTHAQPDLVGGSAAPPSVDIQTGSLAPGAATITTSAPEVGVSERLLIGKWQGTRHLTEYRPDHTRVMDGVSTNPPRTWHLEGDRLCEMPGKNVYKVVALDQNQLVLEGDQGKRYTHQRVQSPALTETSSQSLISQGSVATPAATEPSPPPIAAGERLNEPIVSRTELPSSNVRTAQALVEKAPDFTQSNPYLDVTDRFFAAVKDHRYDEAFQELNVGYCQNSAANPERFKEFIIGDSLLSNFQHGRYLKLETHDEGFAIIRTQCTNTQNVSASINFFLEKPPGWPWEITAIFSDTQFPSARAFPGWDFASFGLKPSKSVKVALPEFPVPQSTRLLTQIQCKQKIGEYYRYLGCRGNLPTNVDPLLKLFGTPNRTSIKYHYASWYWTCLDGELRVNFDAGTRLFLDYNWD